ncbi:hypothetical protein [Streptococcus porci]|uniref:hypothetical protein n=1 Tax=Streptococcus porci TaxID=502567 RepID=UPI00040F7DA6|nr:hypothetical protein [Streptococcus porci]
MSEQNELITRIELTNGEFVPIQTRISLADFQRAQKEGLMSKHMLNDILARRKGNSAFNANDYLNGVFVAYRAAGGELGYQAFLDVCPFDLELLGAIFGQIMTGGKPVKKSQLNVAFEAATKK